MKRNICDAISGQTFKPHLYAAIRKYGPKVFSIEILFLADNQEQLDLNEIEFIKEFNSTDPSIGYNISNGGSGPGLGNKNCLGRYPSKETRLKMSLARLGKPGYWLGKKHSEETKQKMSNIRKGRPGIFIGRKHSEETKRRMSEAHRGHKISNMA